MKKILLVIALAAPMLVFAQEDEEMRRMADSLDALNKTGKEFTRATFKGTRLINFHTVETMGRRALDFRIQHRFGEFNSGAYNAFGTDGPACIRLSLDYGIRDWLQVGIGRTSIDKLVDASFKVRALRQTSDNKMPISISWSSSLNYTFLRDPNKAVSGIDKYSLPVNRISYSNSLIIGRKFSDRLSLQLHGFWVHYNIVETVNDKNDIFAAGVSGRFKLTKRFALTFEYAYRLNNYSPSKDMYQDPLGIGFDLETGGHVFQVHFTNQFGMNEAQFIPYTTSNWAKGGIRLGFNISRVFAIGVKGGNGW
ncbi:MAG TPA: DUF5777 family beta-barrel protein [Bacteroidia bacterium]|nr:DUF5777 family beta-barrel protein [Bacteroidia bacterium]